MPRQPRTPAAETAVPAPEPGKSLFDRVSGFLDANDWHYDSYPGKGYLADYCMEWPNVASPSLRIVASLR